MSREGCTILLVSFLVEIGGTLYRTQEKLGLGCNAPRLRAQWENPRLGLVTKAMETPSQFEFSFSALRSKPHQS